MKEVTREQALKSLNRFCEANLWLLDSVAVTSSELANGRGWSLSASVRKGDRRGLIRLDECSQEFGIYTQADVKEMLKRMLAFIYADNPTEVESVERHLQLKNQASERRCAIEG